MEEQIHEQAGQRLSFDETKELFKELSVHNFTNEFSSRIVTLVIASLGLTTALAWDDTLKELFHALFGPGDSLTDKLFYSTSVTLLAVVVTLVLARILKGKFNKKK